MNFDWLIPWFARRWSGISDLAAAVRDAIKQLVDTFVNAFIRWALAIAYDYTALVSLYSAGINYLAALRDYAAWLVLVRLPGLTAYAIATAVTWAGQQIFLTWQRIDAVVIMLRNEASAAVRSIVDWARGQLAAAFDAISRLWTLATETAKWVFNLLTNPQALADWIAGHIVQAVWRWALGQSEALARWAFARAIHGALFLASLAEQLIVDIFL